MFKQNKKEEVEEVPVPKLTFENLNEITHLVRKYGTTLKVLEYWKMVKLDEKGKIDIICDYSEMNEISSNKYYSYQPLKNINYSGTLVPYAFGSEWISRWSLWIKSRYEQGDKTLSDLAFKDNLTRLI